MMNCFIHNAVRVAFVCLIASKGLQGSDRAGFEIKSDFPTWVAHGDQVAHTGTPIAPSKGPSVFSWWATMGTHYRLYTEAYLGTTRSYPTPSKLSFFPDVTEQQPTQIDPVVGAFSGDLRWYDFEGELDRGKIGHNYAAYLRRAEEAHVDLVWNIGQIHGSHSEHVDLIMSKEGVYYKDLVYQSVKFANTGEFKDSPVEVYWEIGNEINSWKRFGVRDLGPEANNVEHAKDYLEYYLAPAVEAIRQASSDVYGDPNRVPIMMGNLTFLRHPDTWTFLETILDGVVRGDHAPSLAGMHGYELVDIIGIHYSHGNHKLLSKYYDRWVAPGYVDGMWNTEEHGHAGLGDYGILVDSVRWLDFWAQRPWNPNTARVMYWGDQTETNRERTDGLKSDTTGAGMEQFLGTLLQDYPLTRLESSILEVDAEGKYEQYILSAKLPDGNDRILALLIPDGALELNSMKLNVSSEVRQFTAFVQPVETSKYLWDVAGRILSDGVQWELEDKTIRSEDAIILVVEVEAEAVVERSSPVVGMRVGSYWKKGKLKVSESDARALDAVRIGGFPFMKELGVYNFDELAVKFASVPPQVEEVIIPALTTRLTVLKNNPNALEADNWYAKSQDGRTIYQQTFRNFNHNSESLRAAGSIYFDELKASVAELIGGLEGKRVYYGFNNELSMSPRSTIGLKPIDEAGDWKAKSKVHLGYGRLSSFYLPEKDLAGEFLEGFHLTDYSDPTLVKFRHWLEAGYGDLETLNRHWGSDFETWPSVDAPRDITQAADTQAWRDWLTFRYIDFAGLFEWVQGELGDQLPVTHNFIGHRYLMADPYSAVNVHLMAPHLDLVGVDYPGFFDAFILSQTGKPYGILENAVGYTADHMYRNILINGAAGYETLYHWHRSTDFMQERAEMMEGVTQAKAYLPHMDGKMQKGRVGILHSHLTSFDRMVSPVEAWSGNTKASEGDDELKRLTKVITGGPKSFTGVGYLSDVLGVWAGLLEAGYFPCMLDEETLTAADLDGLDAVLLPGLSRMRANTVQLLADYEGLVIAPQDFEIEAGILDPSLGGATVQSVWGNDVAEESDDLNQRMNAENVFLPELKANYGIYDNLQREIIDYGEVETQLVSIAKLAELLESSGVSPDIALTSVDGQAVTGVWFTLLESDDAYRLVLLDYKNWWSWWEAEFHSPASEPIKGLTQPRCFQFTDPEVEAALQPESKDFQLSWSLPEGVEVSSAKLILEGQQQRPLVLSAEFTQAGAEFITQIEGMGFLAIVEIPKDMANRR